MSTLRITKGTAEDVAIAMSKNSIGKEIENIRKQMAELGDKLISKSIPSEIWEAYKKHTSYFYGEVSAYFTADGLSPIYLYRILSKYPEKRGGGTNMFRVERVDYDQLEIWDRQIKSLKEEEESLVYTIKTTLHNLRTLKNIEENLPEALPFLPSSFKSQQSLKPALPLDDIKTMLRKHKLESATSNN